MRYIIIILLVSILWTGCSVIKPQQQVVPTYIHIDSFNFIPNAAGTGVTGSLSHAIGTAWVYYNNSPVGVFDLPATFPVAATGNGTLEVAPGISVNGIEDKQSIYPFYTIDTFNFNASPGNIISHTPATQYVTAASFPFLADFELGDPFTLNAGDTPLVRILYPQYPASMIYEGHGAGYIYLDVPGDSAISISNSANGAGFVIPQANGVGTPFCEFNYKSTMPFYIGLVAISGSVTTGNIISSDAYYLAGVYPSNTWQKFYLQLADFVATYPADSYILVIKANLPTNQANGYVLFDNIKIVTNPN